MGFTWKDLVCEEFMNDSACPGRSLEFTQPRVMYVILTPKLNIQSSKKKVVIHFDNNNTKCVTERTNNNNVTFFY